MVTRILSDIIILLAALLFPGWSFFVLGIFSSYFFNNFFEFILIAIIVDSLYGVPTPGWYNFHFIFTLLALIVFVIAGVFKKKARKY